MKIDFESFKKKWNRPKGKQFPTGTRVYHGFQGSAKTLSAVKYCFEVQKEFPDCLIFSNVLIRGLKNYKFIENDREFDEAMSISNGEKGVICFIDEAHLFFGKRGGIPLEVLTSISQQRKDRRKIILTVQIWEDLDVSLRKQVKEVVKCRTYFGRFQFNKLSNGETLHWDKLQSCYVADKLYTEVYKQNQELYDSYDTFQKIIHNTEYSRDFLPTQNVPRQTLEVKVKK